MSLENFTILDSLGKGSFASVFKAKRKKDGEIYCIKCVYIYGVSHEVI
jgi:serine/threonine protein kinase